MPVSFEVNLDRFSLFFPEKRDFFLQDAGIFAFGGIRRNPLPFFSRRIGLDENDFDPGAKYHIPANTPYSRYFLAAILQFQFHRSLCEIAGNDGPIHRCSIYDSEEAGKRLNAMLEMGRSRPWPEALEALTGSPQMDATAILDYFAPLQAWLDEQNTGRQCGW